MRFKLRRLVLIMTCLITVSAITAVSFAAWSAGNTESQNNGIALGQVDIVDLSATAAIEITQVDAGGDPLGLVPYDQEDGTFNNTLYVRYYTVTVNIAFANADYSIQIKGNNLNLLDSGSALKVSTDAPVAAVPGTSPAAEPTVKQAISGSYADITGLANLTPDTTLSTGETTHTFYLYLVSSSLGDMNVSGITFDIKIINASV